MAATKSAAQRQPAAELKRLLPKINHDELLDFLIEALEEGGRRADNYANLAEEDDVPRDALNEGLAFVIRLKAFTPWQHDNHRARAVRHLVLSAAEDLTEALNA